MASKKRKKKSRRRVARMSAQPKMSAVILELADPLLKHYPPDLTAKILPLALAGWNKAVLPAEMREDIDEKVLEAFGWDTDDEEARAIVTFIMEFMAEQRRKHYPHLWNCIVDYDIQESEGRINLNVVSTPLKAD